MQEINRELSASGSIAKVNVQSNIDYRSISHDDGIRNYNYHAADAAVSITIPGRDDCLRCSADDGATTTTTTTAVAVVSILVLLFLLTIIALVLHPQSQQ